MYKDDCVNLVDRCCKQNERVYHCITHCNQNCKRYKASNNKQKGGILKWIQLILKTNR